MHKFLDTGQSSRMTTFAKMANKAVDLSGLGGRQANLYAGYAEVMAK